MQLLGFPSPSPTNLNKFSPPLLTKPGLSLCKTNYSKPLIVTSKALHRSSKVHASTSKVAVDQKGEDKKSGKQQRKLPAGLKEDLMPKHLAVIMDGNRRWAVERGQSATSGHIALRPTLKTLVELCWQFGIKIVTAFAFSTENWNRPPEEVEFLMELFEEVTKVDIEEMLRHGMRFNVMGDKSMLSKPFQELISEVEGKSKANTGIHVNLAINYSGKQDITQACKNIAAKVKKGVILPEDINESIFEQELGTNLTEFPCPDLLIRTSGEIRLSNFMLWQMAYSELHFVDKYFPDFGENDLVEALCTFQKRRRC